MSGAKHTPGPWRAEDVGVYWTDSISILAPDDGAVACTTRGGWFFDENGEQAPAWPNARLIAAAPELLDALNGLYGLLQLFAARDDVPPEVKNFATNHRAVDALAVLAKVES